MTEKPHAFVIMAFGERFDSIWAELIRPALEDAGYECLRADSQLSTRNILADIVRNIAAANLLVADLTDHNPNVFYELGLAHGLGIPTVLLTQSVAKLPFDLRSYRVIEYSTQFDEATHLKNTLKQIGGDHLARKLSWSDPINDYAPRARRAIAREPALPTALIVQLYRAAAGSLQQFLTVFSELAQAIDAVSKVVDEAFKEVEPLEHADSPADAQMRARLDKLAAPIAHYLETVTLLRKRIAQFDEPMRDAGEDLTTVARTIGSDDQYRKSFVSVFLALQSMSSGAESGLVQIVELNNMLTRLREITHTFDELTDRVFSVHEPLMSICTTAQAVASRTAIVLNESLSPTKEELDAMRKEDAQESMAGNQH